MIVPIVSVAGSYCVADLLAHFFKEMKRCITGGVDVTLTVASDAAEVAIPVLSAVGSVLVGLLVCLCLVIVSYAAWYTKKCMQ